jgi:phosphoribosylaminoimidazolecarboxamide formyltransferase/IMP cyclohydrolase
MAVNVVREADDRVVIRRALVSVSDKTGLDRLIPGLVEINPDIHFFSTGGTFTELAKILGPRAATQLTQVSDYTGQPETQGGLVKTLDFKVYLGLLTETYNEHHQGDLKRTGAVPIDLIVVNLYPFEATVARAGVTLEEARANIDIGGPTMVRASAKNYLRVASLVDPADYPTFLAELRAGNGALGLAQRFAYARKAFALTAKYDAAIVAYLNQQNPAEAPGVYELHNKG